MHAPGGRLAPRLLLTLTLTLGVAACGIAPTVARSTPLNPAATSPAAASPASQSLSGTAPSVQVGTAAGFCLVYTSEKSTFAHRGSGGAVTQPVAPDDPEAGRKLVLDLLQGERSLSDIGALLGKLDAVAPAEIKADMDTVVTTWSATQAGQDADATTQSVLALVTMGGLPAITSSGSWTRVGNYLHVTCGHAI